MDDRDFKRLENKIDAILDNQLSLMRSIEFLSNISQKDKDSSSWEEFLKNEKRFVVAKINFVKGSYIYE